MSAALALFRLLSIDAPEMPGHCRRGRACTPGDPYASKASVSGLVRGQAVIRYDALRY